MPLNPELAAALEAALEREPDNWGLRLHAGALHHEAGDPRLAMQHVQEVLAREPANREALALAVEVAEALGDSGLAEGYRRLLEGLEARPTTREPDASPEVTPTFEEIVLTGFGQEVGAAPTPEFIQSDWVAERPVVTLADVAGMEDVKRRLNLSFLAPLQNPELRRAYQMRVGGGLLLYGPPGCGKTFLARATAGELGFRFIAVGLSDVLDMWFGESERKLHEIFEEARRNAPCILFIDEIDALGHKRSQLRIAPAMRGVVNQLLAELDGVGSDNQGVFVLAATNHPWDVDVALRRPGRFDRTILVLPPDRAARAAILRHQLQDRPTSAIDVQDLASKTEGYSGADLVNLCSTAVQAAMEESLAAGQVRPIGKGHIQAALKEVMPSTRPWFEIAKNFAQFANDGGQYDELLSYMRTRRM